MALTEQQNAALTAFGDALVTAGLLGPGRTPGIIAEYDFRVGLNGENFPPVVGQAQIFWQEGLTPAQIATHQATFDNLVTTHVWEEPYEDYLRRKAKEVFTAPATFEGHASSSAFEMLRARVKALEDRENDTIVHLNKLRARLVANGQTMTQTGSGPTLVEAVPVIPTSGPQNRLISPVLTREEALTLITALLLIAIPDPTP